MKAILSDLVLIAGASCFVIGAAMLVSGSFQPSEPHSITTIGLILTAVGSGLKKRRK
ncbi:MAG: hypothetical protein GX491_16115 [Chloroflexi bacterium]|nr:hypothetical protein [Chloroflexota bacterium]